MIDYKRLADSMEFYESKGFRRIESPWTVTQAVSDITRPKDALDFKLVHDDKKVLVASGEQSFLYLYLKGFLPKGNYQTTTPCFRKDSFDIYHTKYFIKTELINTERVDSLSLETMVDIAVENFRRFIPKELSERLVVVGTDDTSYDINLGGIEIGSYGIRSCEFLDWVYGTGIAEPRMSQVLDMLKRRK
jgi:hypothetical protein